MLAGLTCLAGMAAWHTSPLAGVRVRKKWAAGVRVSNGKMRMAAEETLKSRNEQKTEDRHQKTLIVEDFDDL